MSVRKGIGQSRFAASVSICIYSSSPIKPLPALLLLIFLIDRLINISRTTESSRAQREPLPLFRLLLQAPIDRVQLRDL